MGSVRLHTHDGEFGIVINSGIDGPRMIWALEVLDHERFRLRHLQIDVEGVLVPGDPKVLSRLFDGDEGHRLPLLPCAAVFAVEAVRALFTLRAGGTLTPAHDGQLPHARPVLRVLIGFHGAVVVGFGNKIRLGYQRETKTAEIESDCRDRRVSEIIIKSS